MQYQCNLCDNIDNRPLVRPWPKVPCNSAVTRIYQTRIVTLDSNYTFLSILVQYTSIVSLYFRIFPWLYKYTRLKLCDRADEFKTTRYRNQPHPVTTKQSTTLFCGHSYFSAISWTGYSLHSPFDLTAHSNTIQLFAVLTAYRGYSLGWFCTFEWIHLQNSQHE